MFPAAGVYPRECGETARRGIVLIRSTGLSPRVRGNQHEQAEYRLPLGSIPASAGKPGNLVWVLPPSGVYPRECGETCPVQRRGQLAGGLSPRVRGNRPKPMPFRWDGGSIPASAGKPSKLSAVPSGSKVYPRECGETQLGQGCRLHHVGLSPRVRGNHVCPARRGERHGSIPASAGKPLRRTDFGLVRRVYPRECGETAAGNVAKCWTSGLSPRVRGNRRTALLPETNCGSIPASAGKPGRHLSQPDLAGVYPRECGETFETDPRAVITRGLSPRVRGNLLARVVVGGQVGSIPASAGKPRQ